METAKQDFTGNLVCWCVPVVGGHFITIVWHLVLVLKIQPNFPRFAVPLLLLVNLLPVAGLIALPKGHRKLTGLLIAGPLAIALIFGAYSHFLSPGTDNVFHMPPGNLRLPFQASAVILVLFEMLGCWLGITVITYLSPDHTLGT